MSYTQVREAYSKWWYNKKMNFQCFSKIYFTKSTSLQISVSYNNVIILTFYFLQNNVKKSEKSVPAVNNSAKHTLGTLDGMFI